jgi:integrase
LVFDFVEHHEVLSIRNPLDKVTIPASDEDHPAIRLLSPEEVFALMERLPGPISIAVLLVGATGLRISEFLALRWRHVLWEESKISSEQVFRRGEILKRTKTKASKAPVPMCEALATTLSEFRQQTEYSRDEDFVFASPTLDGIRPLWGQTMNARFVKPAAVALGLASESERFGWHRFRHSLSTWANETTKDVAVLSGPKSQNDPLRRPRLVQRRDRRLPGHSPLSRFALAQALLYRSARGVGRAGSSGSASDFPPRATN